MAFVAPHCDIEERLEFVPPSARVRGFWFRIVEREVASHGLANAYHKFFQQRRHSTLRYYSARDYLVRVAVAGAVIKGPEELHAGMFEIARHNAAHFADSLFGQTLIRLLAPQPARVVKQGIAARRQTMTYGHWELLHVADRALTIDFREEYMWIESHVAGSWKGTFEAIGIDAELECDLVDRFNGQIHVRW